MHVIVTFCLAIGISKPKANTLPYCVANQHEPPPPPPSRKILKIYSCKIRIKIETLKL